MAQSRIQIKDTLTDEEMFDTPDTLTDDDFIADYIRSNEGVSDTPVYTDTGGTQTFGIGHKLLPDENPDELDEEETFNKDLKIHTDKTKKLFPKYEDYPIEIKQSLVDGVFRGDLSGSPKTIKLINEGKWDKVSDEYINHKEYKDSKASETSEKPWTGVYKRMDRNAEAFKNYSDTSSTRPQATANAPIEPKDTLTDEEMNTPDKPNLMMDTLKRISLDMSTLGVYTPLKTLGVDLEKPIMAGLEKSGAIEAGKGAVSTALSAPQAFGSLIQEFGERAEESPDWLDYMMSGAVPMMAQTKQLKSILFKKTDLDEKAITLGTKIIEKNKEFMKTMPELEAVKEPGFKQFMFNLGSGVTTLGGAIGITALTKSPHAAAVLFGMYQKGQIYQQAKDAGLDTKKSGRLSTLAGGVEGVLEYLGLDFMLKSYGGPIFSMAVRSGTEAAQEWLQTTGENLVVKLGGIDNARDIFEGAGQSALIGLLLGAGASASITMAERGGVIEALKNGGLDEKEAKKIASKITKDVRQGVVNLVQDEKGFALIPGEGKKIEHKTYSGLVKRMQEKTPKLGLDDIAKTLQEEGTLKVPTDRNADEYLKDLIDSKAKLPTEKVTLKTQKEFEKELRAEIAKDKAEGIDFDPVALEAEIQKDLDKFKQGIIKEVKQAESPKLTKGKVKPVIHKSTGYKKSIDVIVTNEMALLKQQLSSEAKGAKVGERVGKAEIRSQEAIKRHVTGLVSSLKSMGDRKLPVEYKDQVDAILEQYDLKGRMDVTKEKRANITEFVDTMREQGDLAFVPREFFRDYGEKTTLDEMTLEDLEHLHDQVKVLVTAGSNEGKLISFEKELNLEETVDNLAETIYKRGKMAEPTEEELRYKPPSARKKSVVRRKMDSTSKYASGNRKVENITQVLRIWDKVWNPIQKGTNTELIKGGEMNAKFKQIFSPIAKISAKMLKPEIKVEGMADPITRWEAVGVALNSENFGNVQRLIKGNQYTEEQIKAIKAKLTPTEKKFVEDTFKLIDSYWADTEANTIKAVGVRPKKVSGKYFPIKTDYSQDINAQIRASQKDVMKEVFSKAFLEKSFIKSRVGGAGAVDLDVLPIILKHLKDVIHYNAFVLPMRDTQKIINHPKFKKAVIDVMGEATYSEFKPWLANTVNPKTLSPQNIFEVGASMLRKNSTASILGIKVSVSLLQGGSFLQTVNKIGLKSALGGVADFYHNPKTTVKFVYSKSPEMKYRSTLWDRELKDWMERKQAQNILKGLPGDSKSVLFAMIRGVDFLTVMPSWMGAYNRELSISGDETKAIEYADSIVRTTQPMGSVKDLPRMLRGRPFMKLFTMFKSFYTTMHNQMVDIKDEYRFSDEPFISKTGKAATGYFWVWIAPALLATWIRSGFKEKDIKKYAKAVGTFPLQGLFVISDIANSLSSGFGMGTPALKGVKELEYGVKGKKPYTKIKHLSKAVGTFAGVPVDSLWTFGEGAYDLYKGKTSDPRRLVYSKYALGEKKKEEDWLKQFKKEIRGDDKDDWLKKFKKEIRA